MKRKKIVKLIRRHIEHYEAESSAAGTAYNFNIDRIEALQRLLCELDNLSEKSRKK